MMRAARVLRRSWNGLVAELEALHVPVNEEAEVWEDGPGADIHDERFPLCPAVLAPHGECPGHDIVVKVCAECGYSHDGDSTVFRVWPCPTLKAIYTRVAP